MNVFTETSSDVCDDELLVKAIREGKVDSRGALGVRFDRFLNSDTEQKEVGFALQCHWGFPRNHCRGLPEVLPREGHCRDLPEVFPR